jgi:hypothetical protein
MSFLALPWFNCPGVVLDFSSAGCKNAISGSARVLMYGSLLGLSLCWMQEFCFWVCSGFYVRESSWISLLLGVRILFLGLVVRKSTNCYPSELHIHRTKLCACDVVERG